LFFISSTDHERSTISIAVVAPNYKDPGVIWIGLMPLHQMEAFSGGLALADMAVGRTESIPVVLGMHTYAWLDISEHRIIDPSFLDMMGGKPVCAFAQLFPSPLNNPSCQAYNSYPLVSVRQS
jgi:hypothetical protein